MARFYTNENVPVQVVAELRRMGHDVVTSLDAGNATSAVPDAEFWRSRWLMAGFS
jgi:hypothetical protein